MFETSELRYFFLTTSISQLQISIDINEFSIFISNMRNDSHFSSSLFCIRMYFCIDFRNSHWFLEFKKDIEKYSTQNVSGQKIYYYGEGKNINFIRETRTKRTLVIFFYSVNSKKKNCIFCFNFFSILFIYFFRFLVQKCTAEK